MQNMGLKAVRGGLKIGHSPSDTWHIHSYGMLYMGSIVIPKIPYVCVSLRPTYTMCRL